MQRRVLGNSGLEVSPIALGCLAMGADGSWGPVNDNESIAAIQTALDLGINLIDTSPYQGGGHSEILVGKAIQSRRDEVIISSKCGLFHDPDDSLPRRCLKKDAILHECEGSLRRLRVDTIDLYQCHWPDPKTPIVETMGAMELLLRQGKIRAIGLCNYGCERLHEARTAGTVHACQMLLNMLQRQVTEELLPYCQEYRMGVLAYSPLCKGLLTGKFDRQSRFEDLRRNHPEFLGVRFARNLAILEKLRRISQNYGKTVGQLALNWACNHPGVTAVILGAKRPSQIRENVGALGWQITTDDLDEIHAILKA
ncbi:MAG: aldo/keto reductase [Phycisphaerales bacterium]|nr:MAG: aldo/keto reductase [Phycisphaerales bacterium]